MTIEPITGLYVPGHRPDRFGKAAAAAPDVVVVDLEDAVPGDRKDEARLAAAEFAATTIDPVVQIRVNPSDTTAGQADLAMVATLPPAVQLRLPKAEHPDDVARALDMAGPRPLTALLETPAAVLNALPIALADGTTALGLGESDLSSVFGIRSDALVGHARLTVAYACRAAGLPAPMLSPYPALGDQAGLEADTLRGRSLGWMGRMAVHPVQLDTIRRVFAPTEDDIAWARRVLEALAADGGAARLPNGDMVDPAMRGRAEAILRRA
jgi:citrate lyase subunit beta/citryl-CoA lyase